MWLALLDAIQITARQERKLEAEIIERLELHADAHISATLPGAGHGVGAEALLARARRCPRPLPRQRLPCRPRPGPRRSPSPPPSAAWSSSAAPAQKLRNSLIDFADDSRRSPPGAAKVDADAWPDRTPPSRSVHPGPRLDPGDLAHLARQSGLRPRHAPRGGDASGRLNPSPTHQRLTEGTHGGASGFESRIIISQRCARSAGQSPYLHCVTPEPLG